jgi:hypothetical protein
LKNAKKIQTQVIEARCAMRLHMIGQPASAPTAVTTHATCLGCHYMLLYTENGFVV